MMSVRPPDIHKEWRPASDEAALERVRRWPVAVMDFVRGIRECEAEVLLAGCPPRT